MLLYKLNDAEHPEKLLLEMYCLKSTTVTTVGILIQVSHSNNWSTSFTIPHLPVWNLDLSLQMLQ